MVQHAVTKPNETPPSWMTAWKDAVARRFDSRPARFDEWFAEAWFSSGQGKTWKRSGFGLLVSATSPRRWRVEVSFRRGHFGSLLGVVSVYPRGGKHPAFPAKRSRALKRKAAYERKRRFRAFGATESSRFVWYGLPCDMAIPPAVVASLLSSLPAHDLAIYPLEVRPNPDYDELKEASAWVSYGWSEYPPHW